MDGEVKKMEQNLSRGRKLWTLFTSLLYISAFTFGGGFVIVTFMKRRFVDKLGWLDEQEMLDMTALAQSSPGPIALNAAIQVGWRVGGAVGMVIATIATILPPMIILTVVSIFYSAFANNEYVALVLKGMQAGVAAVIADVVCDLGGKVLKTKSWIHIVLMLAAFIATYFLNINVIFVILASALIGTLGVIIPSLIIVSLLYFVYRKYREIPMLKSVLTCLRPTVVALIASAGLSILLMVIGVGEAVNYIGIALFAVAFFALRKFKFNPILTMLACGIINLVIHLIFKI